MSPPTSHLSVESTLRHCELLEPLSEAQFTALSDHCTMVNLREGEALFDENTVAHSLFVVASGRLAIRLATPAGRVIEVILRGRPVRPVRLVVDFDHASLRGRQAKALEDSTVIAISADEVEDILLREPAAGYVVMKQVAGVIFHHSRTRRS